MATGFFERFERPIAFVARAPNRTGSFLVPREGSPQARPASMELAPERAHARVSGPGGREVDVRLQRESARPKTTAVARVGGGSGRVLDHAQTRLVWDWHAYT